MAYRIRNLEQHFANDGEPKRILALDGGGLRGILSLGVLAHIESVLRERHDGGNDFRLAHYFDLIAGTSTGAIIAAALALGWSVEDLRKNYMSLGEHVFEKSLLRDGLLRAKYDESRLSDELRKVFGARTCIGGAELSTGLLVITKRLDTGSPWPIGNNPNGRYFKSRDRGVIGNGDYPLWQVVRASTAAPSFFDPERITIAQAAGATPVRGDFVDGGVSPYNNPSLQAMMYATMAGYRVGWPTGAENLLLVSVGTGSADPAVTRSAVAAKHAISALKSLIEDCANLQETMMQWLSSSPTARTIDRELGELDDDLAGGAAMLSYLRYNTRLDAESVHALEHGVTDQDITNLSAMDAPENMTLLHKLGLALGKRDVLEAHFPAAFDLREG